MLLLPKAANLPRSFAEAAAMTLLLLQLQSQAAGNNNLNQLPASSPPSAASTPRSPPPSYIYPRFHPTPQLHSPPPIDSAAAGTHRCCPNDPPASAKWPCTAQSPTASTHSPIVLGISPYPFQSNTNSGHGHGHSGQDDRQIFLFHLTQAIKSGDWAAVEAAAVYISKNGWWEELMVAVSKIKGISTSTFSRDEDTKTETDGCSSGAEGATVYAVDRAPQHTHTHASAAREFQRNMNRSLHRTKSWSRNSSGKDEDDDYTHAHDQNTPQYFQLPQTSSMMDLRLTDIRKQVTYLIQNTIPEELDQNDDILIQFQHSEIQSIPQFDLGCVTRNFG